MSHYKRPLRPDELMHHGVKGQKWGIQNGPPYPLSSDISTGKGLKEPGARFNNIDRWGRDADHNTLYISGVSGSGKSTLSEKMKDKFTDVIHLDLYFEDSPLVDRDFNKHSCSGFNDHIKDFDFKKRLAHGPKGTKEFGKSLDEFEGLLESYSRKAFLNGKRLIVEGTQLNDDTLYPNKSFFDDKPTAKMTVSEEIAKKRAAERDSKQ